MSIFEGFPKMARLSRDVVVTEKIDGTNAQIFIAPRSSLSQEELDHPTIPFMCVGEDIIVAGSRNRYIDEKNDNAGFGRWVSENREELIKLGYGRHFGEWWGSGIQRRYGLDYRKFSLFNTHRWKDDRPNCCDVVPVLYEGPFDTGLIDDVLNELKEYGSTAAPGFMDPEGIIVYHTAGNVGFKKTIKDDGVPKSLATRTTEQTACPDE